MPDWSYTTVTGPIFRRGSHERGRRFVNRFFELVGRVPGGHRLVDFLGHMAPDPSLGLRLPNGRTLASPLVLMPCVDPEGRASAAFSRFGVGALVVGPVALARENAPSFRQALDGSLWGEGGAAASLDEAKALRGPTRAAVLFFELDPFASGDPEAAVERLVTELGPRAEAFILTPQRHAELAALDDEGRTRLLQRFQTACRAQEAVPFLGLPLDATPEDVRRGATTGLPIALSGRRADGGYRWDGRLLETTLSLVEAAAEAEGPLFVDGGLSSPRDALALVDAGADLVGIGPGLVQVGPGLAKRVNEALVDRRADHREMEDDEPALRRPWLWGAALGFAMLFGAILAGWSALTTVLLPYDEEFLGRTARDIASFNPRVLSFMTHDRITLAGTMVSIGVLYATLSIFALRRGEVWAQHVIGASASLGFLSFFGFLGFGYLDPFHAFVTAVLLQFLIQLLVRRVGPKQPRLEPAQLDDDPTWRRALWGQLCFVIHGAALILAGTTILTFGMTVVFVPQDISYLGCDAHAIRGFDDQLQSLIAHDRATFGGMLLSGGVALLLTSMWSFRRGDRWLFWMLLVVILAPYAMTLWIHWDIGYRDHFHLAPVYIGLGLLFLGLALAGPHLLRRSR